MEDVGVALNFLRAHKAAASGMEVSMEDVGVALNFLRAHKAAASGMKVIHAWSAGWWDLTVCTKRPSFNSQGLFIAWGKGELQGNLGSRKDLGGGGGSVKF